MVVRNDVDVKLIGREAVLLEDSSPFVLGTQGQNSGSQFTFVGRIRRAWADGQWNEWFLIFEDQRRGWLAEAQGQLMIFFEAELSQIPPANKNKTSSDQWAVGDSVRLANRDFTVTDIKQAKCIGSEGELPDYCRPGEISRTVDLTAMPNACATIDITDKPRLYLGTFVEFEKCRFTRLRSIPGW